MEKTLENLLDCKEIKPVNPSGDQFWMFIGRTDAEAEFPILWPPEAKNWIIRKDPDAGKDWRWEEKGTTEEESWLTLLTLWTWVWTSFGIWWWRGKPGVLHPMELQRVGQDWATELIHDWRLECKSEKCRDTWNNRQIWPWRTKWSRAERLIEFCQEKALVITNTLFQKEITLPMDITKQSIPKSNLLHSLLPKMEKLYMVSKNKTWSWLWLRSSTFHSRLQT